MVRSGCAPPCAPTSPFLVASPYPQAGVLGGPGAPTRCEPEDLWPRLSWPAQVCTSTSSLWMISGALHRINPVAWPPYCLPANTCAVLRSCVSQGMQDSRTGKFHLCRPHGVVFAAFPPLTGQGNMNNVLDISAYQRFQALRSLFSWDVLQRLVLHNRFRRCPWRKRKLQ